MRHRLLGVGRVGGQEGQADAVRAGGREREGDRLAEEAVGDLDEDAGAVAGVDLGARGAPVVEVAERVERVVDDLAALLALDVGDERHAARVVLEARVVEPEGLGCRAEGQARRRLGSRPLGRTGGLGSRHLTSTEGPAGAR